MAKKKSIKKTPVILRNALSVYERSITRFSDVVCQFTVQNGNQITYDVLEVSANPDPTPRVERSITRFKEVVCEFVVIDGTDVHAYELEPVYVDLTGGGITYTITNNLTNVTNSNAAASIGDGDPYTATLTADAGYTIDNVVVTMGGIDVTSSVYSAGSINIAAVTGNIVITASASAGSTDTYIKEIRQGAISGGSPASNRVSLILNQMETDGIKHLKLTISDPDIQFYAPGYTGNQTPSNAGNPSTSNVVYVYAVNKNTSYVYKSADTIPITVKANNTQAASNFGWKSWSDIDYTIEKTAEYEVSITGLAWEFRFSNDADITPTVLRNAITIQEVI